MTFLNFLARCEISFALFVTDNEISLDKLRVSKHQSQADQIPSSSRSRHSSGISGNESADDDDDLILGMFTSSEEREK